MLLVTNKKGITSELTTVGIFDETAEGFLTLYGPASASASPWIPSRTVLLIAKPGWRIDRTVKLSLNANTQLHIDPDLADARYVQALAQRLDKKEHVNPAFPSSIFDVDAAEGAAVKVLYKLSEIDEFARANPREKAIGYLSVLVTELHIVINYKRNMLMSTECCGLPVFANTVSARCRQCDKETSLRINPRIVRQTTPNPAHLLPPSPTSPLTSHSSAPSSTKPAKSPPGNSPSRTRRGNSSWADRRPSSSPRPWT